MIPEHFYQGFACTTLLWTGTDSQELFEKNCADSATRARLQEHGWLDEPALTYQFNSHGFRDDEFDQRSAGLALGCSHTQGMGIRPHQTWPAQLGKMLGEKIWNLGVGGCSLDTCYRLLDYWIDELEPKFVVCAVPEQSRYEVFTHSHWMSVVATHEFDHDHPLVYYHKNHVLYPQNSELNQRKNLQAMQYRCHERGIPFYANLLDRWGAGSAAARDLMHHGAKANWFLATQFYKQIKGTNYESTTSSH